jgi:hypothetical protein
MVLNLVYICSNTMAKTELLYLKNVGAMDFT